MAKLIKAIFGVVDGEVYPREIAAGEECPQGLEAYAASIDAIDIDEAKAAAEAEAKAAAEAEAKAAAEAKADKKAPENK